MRQNYYRELKNTDTTIGELAVLTLKKTELSLVTRGYDFGVFD
jgi:hypothetical protein